MVLKHNYTPLPLCVGHLKMLKSSLLSLSELHTGRLLMMPSYGKNTHDASTDIHCLYAQWSACAVRQQGEDQKIARGIRNKKRKKWGERLRITRFSYETYTLANCATT
jgi:hypothetical protein